MPKRFLIAAAVIVVAGAVAAGAQLGLRNDGVQFPDNTVQTSAAETPGVFVQASASIGIPDPDECGAANLYAVPAGKRLRIEWMSVELEEMGSIPPDPVDLSVETWLGGVQVSHPLVRLEGSQVIGSSFFWRVPWSTNVTLYNQGGKTVQISACRHDSVDSTGINVTFHGQLFNE